MALLPSGPYGSVFVSRCSCTQLATVRMGPAMRTHCHPMRQRQSRRQRRLGQQAPNSRSRRARAIPLWLRLGRRRSHLTSRCILRRPAALGRRARPRRFDHARSVLPYRRPARIRHQGLTRYRPRPQPSQSTALREPTLPKSPNTRRQSSPPGGSRADSGRGVQRVQITRGNVQDPIHHL